LSPRPVTDEPVGEGSGPVGTREAEDGKLEGLPF
jgi:hypothetical protein